jgi:hypothetical protein
MVARRYDGHDIPGEDKPLSILVPGVPEAHRAYEVTTGGLRPIQQNRVTGGVSVTLDSFTTQAIVLLSGEPTVTAYLQEQLRLIAPQEIASARGLAAGGLASAGELLGRLPPAAFTGPPPVAAVPMLTEANRLAAEGEALVISDPVRGVAKLRKAAAIAGQFERRIWENAVKAEGSMVASPLVVSDATLAEAWQFVGARTNTATGEELITSGDMERLDALATGGWRHFARTDSDVLTSVDVRLPTHAGATEESRRGPCRAGNSAAVDHHAADRRAGREALGDFGSGVGAVIRRRQCRWPARVRLARRPGLGRAGRALAQLAAPRPLSHRPA